MWQAETWNAWLSNKVVIVIDVDRFTAPEQPLLNIRCSFSTESDQLLTLFSNSDGEHRISQQRGTGQ